MLEIRRYQDQDYDAVWNLHIVTMQQVGAYRGEGTWDDDLRDIETHYFRNKGEFLVGVYQGRIVAMGAFQMTNSHRAELKKMRVHPEFQGKGFGQTILEALEVNAQAIGYRILHLETSVLQIAAQKLYEKNGFSETGRVEIDGFNCILYTKNL